MEGLAALIYLGCYADAQNPLGLKTVELDTATGEMRITSEHRVSNAIYQAVSPDGKTLYSCTGDGLASFQLAADGSIAERTDEIALGKCVCHVAAMQARDRDETALARAGVDIAQLRRAVVMAEVLDRPVSLRRRRRAG